jgi:hypothetical protein
VTQNTQPTCLRNFPPTSTHVMCPTLIATQDQAQPPQIALASALVSASGPPCRPPPHQIWHLLLRQLQE